MRRSLITLLFTAVAWAQSTAAGAPPAREIDNVAAFARLYGVVRYFYPSDAAAGLDWNRFVAHGVSRVRSAVDARSLEAALKELFLPLGPGIVIGATLPPVAASTQPAPDLVAWRYLGPALSGDARPYARKRTHRTDAGSMGIDGFVTLMQTAPALALRGKTIRLRGQVRATAADSTGSAALWLRVDRERQAQGFFDNMGNRPIRNPEWREYEIEGTVADDATSVAFGMMASGPVTADFDAIDLAQRDAAGAWTPIPVADAGFEAALDTATGGWSRAGSSKNATVTRPGDRPPQGSQFLRFAAPAGPVSQAELFEEGAPTAGAHADVDLGAGLKARVPLALSDAQARAVDPKNVIVPTAGPNAAMLDVDVRLSDVVVAWNVFRHFYPYWTEAGVDWNTRLRPQLEAAYAADSREAQLNALRSLVADARDGHGGVNDLRRTQPPGILPVRLGLIEDRLVVTASDAPSDAPVGAVITTIGGAPAADRLAGLIRLASGTTQWKQARALEEISTCAKGVAVPLVVDDGSGPRPGSVPCDTRQRPAEKRPQPVAELGTGVWYVDLTRAAVADLTPVMEKLAGAAGVVFDLRGYPTEAGFQMLTHLIDAPESDRWMHVPKIVGPFGQTAGWLSVGWDLKPAGPHFSGKIAFMTDGRAISYAESVMGYVADRKLGTIVGGTTAGTNGNVVRFVLPGEFAVTFTGMRVTRHDGKTPYHLAGTRPDVAVVPTIAGVRAGRDEVLEKALAVVQAK